MSTIMELRSKRATTWEQAKAFLDSKRNENGIVSAEDTAVYEKMETEVVNLGKEIERLERREALDREMALPTSNPITEKPQTAGSAKKTGRASNEYKEDFGRVIRGRSPIHNVMQEGVDADGGFLVPEEFENQIVTDLAEQNVIRSIAKVITTGADHKIPVAASHTIAQWVAENGAYQESNPTFAQKNIDAHKLTDLVKVSKELLQDSYFDLEAYIQSEFVRAFAAAEEEAFCVGTGIGQPTGIFHSSQGGTISVTSTKPTEISVDELISLIYNLKAGYRKNAAFLMKDTTVSMLRKLKDGNGQYLWQPSVQANTPDRLLGYPLYTSPYAPAVAAGTLPVAFGDFKNYWIGDRLGRTVQKLVELYAGNGQVGFLCTQRVDGRVVLPEGIQLLQQHA